MIRKEVIEIEGNSYQHLINKLTFLFNQQNNILERPYKVKIEIES